MSAAAASTSGAPLRLQRGRPWPLGAHCTAGGVNFAVWAPDAQAVELCLFDASGRHETARLVLPACSDGVWHGQLAGAAAGLIYGLRAHGPWAPAQGHRFNPAKVLLDPWAQEVVGRYGRQGPGAADDAALAAELALFSGHCAQDAARPDAHDNAAVALKARVPCGTPVSPDGARAPRPHIDPARRILYEVHVRSISMRHPAVPAALRGSYAALAHPALIEHFHRLGVTTLSLLPLQFRADEIALQRRGLANHWGYSPIAWLAPENRYWSGRAGSTPASELRETIDRLHAAGLEVVLDMVFNHSAETDASGPTLSLRGLANARYYHLWRDDRARYRNWTGCGNSLNLAEARVTELVIGALRHWAEHYGVDGFRFDLASTLARGRNGPFDADAPFFAALQADPQLAGRIRIAEPWDAGESGYQLGRFPPGWQEWNDQYRDGMRRWWLRGEGDRARFAQQLAGSAAHFHHDARAPTASLNYLCAHDGYTLRDLVSYEQRHNAANGEDNRDGQHDNASWNCGIEGEGETESAARMAPVRALRGRLRRALLATLLCSQGTPMLLAGDEIGHTQRGNNNAYCQDNDLSWLQWQDADPALLAATARLGALRQRFAALRPASWLQQWHSPHAQDANASADAARVAWLHPDGHALHGAEWHDAMDRALAVRLAAAAGAHADERGDVLLLVNPQPGARRFVLPAGRWQAAFDSDSADGSPADERTADGGTLLEVSGRSLQAFIAAAPGAGS